MAAASILPGRQQQPPVTRLGRGSEFKEIKEHDKDGDSDDATINVNSIVNKARKGGDEKQKNHDIESS